MITVNEAIEKISIGQYAIETFRNVNNIDKDIKKAIEILKTWQKKKQLGEVYFNYYEQTGKTATLSIAFNAYDILINDLDQNFVEFEEYELKEEMGEDYWESVSIQFEDEGDTWHDDILLLIEKNKNDSVFNKAKVNYLTSQLKEHFGKKEFIDELMIALENRIQLIDNDRGLRELFDDNGEENVFHDDFIELIKLNDNMIDDTKSIQWNVDKILGWVTFFKTKESKYFMTNDF